MSDPELQSETNFGLNLTLFSVLNGEQKRSEIGPQLRGLLRGHADYTLKSVGCNERLLAGTGALILN